MVCQRQAVRALRAGGSGVNLAPARDRGILDVLGATGGVRVSEPDVTGVDAESLSGWVTGLTIAHPGEHRYFLVETVGPSSGLRVFTTDPTCLAIAKEAGTFVEPDRMLWSMRIGEGLAATGCGHFIERGSEQALYRNDWTWPIWVHGPAGHGGPAAAADVVERASETRGAQVVPAEAEPAELVAAAQQIRALTKLPVQDVGAMLGIKRRQFYNWLDGTSEPPSDRIRRLFALLDAASRLSAVAGGDARRVRLALLAPIAGDSVFDAFAADDAERIEASVEAAERALLEGARLVRRVPPSARVRSDPGAAKEVRLERDSLGLYQDHEILDSDDRS